MSGCNVNSIHCLLKPATRIAVDNNNVDVFSKSSVEEDINHRATRMNTTFLMCLTVPHAMRRSRRPEYLTVTVSIAKLIFEAVPPLFGRATTTKCIVHTCRRSSVRAFVHLYYFPKCSMTSYNEYYYY